METYPRKTSHKQMQSILLNLITLKATSPNWADFLYLVCGAARQLVDLFLRPAFCGSQHGLTNLLSVSLRFFPLLCQLIQVLLSGAQGLELLFRPFLTYFFCGAPRRFLLSFLSFFVLASSFAAGFAFAFKGGVASASPFLFLALVEGAGSAPVFASGGSSFGCGTFLSASLPAFLGNTGAS